MSGEGVFTLFGSCEVVLHQTESHAKAEYACNSHGFDSWSATGIPNNVSQKLSQYPCAACGLGGYKADAISACLPSKKKEEILLRTDYRRPTGIPNNVRQKLNQNPCAACRLGSHKADAIRSVFPSRRKKKSYSELITGAPPASRMTSAISSARTRAPLAVSGATKLRR